MNRRANLTEAALRELYFAQRRTIDAIATRFDVAPTTIRRRFTDLGIPARPRGSQQGPRRRIFPSVEARPDFAWTAELAYCVGLIATDGNLSPNHRTLSVTSKDLDLLETLRQCLGLHSPIGRSANGRGQFHHRLQWTDRHFYRWLVDTGLMPAKSLRLGPLAVPDRWFPDFLRGCLDGDGSIVTYVDRYNSFKSPSYVYHRLFVSLVSASAHFLEWVRDTVLRLRGLSGSLTVRRRTARHDLWCLKYAKRESVAVLRWIYYAPDVPSLRRKRAKADHALRGAQWYRRAL